MSLSIDLILAIIHNMAMKPGMRQDNREGEDSLKTVDCFPSCLSTVTDRDS